jgi:GAF domain-containing protein
MAVAGTSEPPRAVGLPVPEQDLASLTAGTLEEAALHAVREWSSLFRVSGVSLSLIDGSMLRELAYVSELREQRSPAEDYAIADYPLTAQTLASRRTSQVRADDGEADQAEIALLHEFGWQAVLLVPLLAPDRPVGLIELFESRPRTFTADEQRLALALGQYLASTLARLVSSA